MMKVTTQTTTNLFANILNGQKKPQFIDETKETHFISELIKQTLTKNSEVKSPTICKKQKIRQVYGIDKLKIDNLLNPNIETVVPISNETPEELLGKKFLLENVMKNIVNDKSK
eukprot:gene11821-5152_t